MSAPADLEKSINDSGFPLQLSLKRLVETQTGGDWSVVLSEHPWRDPFKDDEKFIDLVLQGKTYFTLVVECKRARDTEWLFVREPAADGGVPGNRRLTRAILIRRLEDKYPSVYEWTDVPCVPASPLAQFCVIRKNGKASQELLEKTASEVVRATEAISKQELAIHTREQCLGPYLGRIYVPVIVTTANLFICDGDYNKIDLASGELTGFRIAPAHIVRFEKSLGAGQTRQRRDPQKLEEATSERSVVVVQALAFRHFLENWDVGDVTATAASSLLSDYANR
jgi:hypothetical protein